MAAYPKKDPANPAVAKVSVSGADKSLAIVMECAMTNQFKKSNNLRKARNNDILRKLQNGEPLSSFNSQSSWFPPRPVIEKDPEAVKKLYGAQPDRRLQRSEEINREQTDEVKLAAQPLKLA